MLSTQAADGEIRELRAALGWTDGQLVEALANCDNITEDLLAEMRYEKAEQAGPEPTSAEPEPAKAQDTRCEVHVEPAQVLAVARQHSASGSDASMFIAAAGGGGSFDGCKLEIVWENERKLGFGQVRRRGSPQLRLCGC